MVDHILEEHHKEVTVHIKYLPNYIGYINRESKYKKNFVNPWSPGGLFVVQKMAITSSIPVF